MTVTVMEINAQWVAKAIWRCTDGVWSDPIRQRCWLRGGEPAWQGACCTLLQGCGHAGADRVPCTPGRLEELSTYS